jgi:hypothetical protein
MHRAPSLAMTTLAVAYLTSFATTSITTFASIHQLYTRQTCAVDANLTACGNGLPSSWCCPPNTVCLQINNTGTQNVLCCPENSGNDCSTIAPITCNITLQDPNLFPQASIHIGNTSLTLDSCGTSGGKSSCCPLGFECQTNSGGQSVCAIKASSKEPQTSGVASVSGVMTSSIPGVGSQTEILSPPTGTAGTIVAASPSTTADSSGGGGPSRGAWAAIGVVIGLIVVACACFLLWLFRKKRKQKRSAVQSAVAELDGRQKSISEPIYDPQLAARSDFLNRYRPERPNRPSEEDDKWDDVDLSADENTITRPSTGKSYSPGSVPMRDTVRMHKTVIRGKDKRGSSPTRMVTIKMDMSTPQTTPITPPSFHRQFPGGILKSTTPQPKKPEVYVPSGKNVRLSMSAPTSRLGSPVSASRVNGTAGMFGVASNPYAYPGTMSTGSPNQRVRKPTGADGAVLSNKRYQL